MKIFAFSDEAAPDLAGQIAAMKRNRLDGTEIRGVDGRNVTVLTLQEAAGVLHRLKEFWPYWYVNFTNGVKYWKRVRKARYYSDYEEAVCELFQKEEIIPGACFEAYSIR